MSVFDFEEICNYNGVDIAPSSNRHYRRGWVNIHCPFCEGSRDYHLGYNIEQRYFRCWRCGWHSVHEVLSTIVSDRDVQKLVKQCRTSRPATYGEVYTPPTNVTKCKLPLVYGKLPIKAKKYLRSRRFSPSKLEALWDIKYAQTISKYKGRIVIPIYFKGRLVSFQTRDVTGRAKLRYITAPRDNEVIHHKHIVYGYDNIPADTAVIVEGVTDVWRFGYGAVCTFGIEYTQEQVKLLATIPNRYVLFDQTEEQAKKQGERLADELSCFNGTTGIVEISKYKDRDPAAYPQKFADSIMERLLY